MTNFESMNRRPRRNADEVDLGDDSLRGADKRRVKKASARKTRRTFRQVMASGRTADVEAW